MTSIRFLGDLPLWAGALLAMAASLGIWRYYRRESYDLPGRLRWILPLLRAAAFFLVLLILTGPVLHHRQVIGQLGRVLIFVDGSGSMGVTDTHMEPARKLRIARQQGWLPAGEFDASALPLAAPTSPALVSAMKLFDQASRWRRGENDLLDPSAGLIAQLVRTHDVELFALSGSHAARLWDSRTASVPPKQLAARPEGRTTDLGSGIAAQMSALGGRKASGGESPAETRTAIVLLTDGQHNAVGSPLETARVLGGQGIPLYAVGFGATREPPDLALVGAEYPDMVFQKDRIRGVLIVKDQMPPGQSFVVQVAQGNQTVWQQRLTTQNVPLRRIEFEFPIDALVEGLRTASDKEVRHYAVPVSLQASITPLEGETETTNNQWPLRFAAITRSYKLLVIDGRSRWETRYLRNVFERDPQWQVDAFLVGPGTDQAALPHGDGPHKFPADEAALLDYDLIVLGEVPPEVLSKQEQEWIRNFVERRGGGLVLVDGSRGHLRRLGDTLAPLLPVTWLPVTSVSSPTRLALTGTGAGEAAWMFKPSREENESFWQQLPVPRHIVPVAAAPGTEVLVEAIVQGKAMPAMVTRAFGAGRVLYCAFDETWRWRYKVADTYHERFWNQVAQWIMPRPYAVSDQYVSLDTGPISYPSGAVPEVRARVQGVDGRPAGEATVDALVWRDGRVVSTVSLAPDKTASGVYRGRTGPLAEGHYEVTIRASGFSQEAMKARTSFDVLAPQSGELRQVASNEDLLRQLAAATGGRFLREEEIGELRELLRPLSRGRVIESDTLLWQSYWWFGAIVGLLTIEWTLRKRAGLL